MLVAGLVVGEADGGTAVGGRHEGSTTFMVAG